MNTHSNKKMLRTEVGPHSSKITIERFNTGILNNSGTIETAGCIDTAQFQQNAGSVITPIESMVFVMRLVKICI